MSLWVVGIGILCTALNYLILASFDFISFKRLKLSFMTYPGVILNAFICYAVNLNLGSLIGGIGFRYRLYTKRKVSKEHIPFIVISSTLANWSGYVFLVILILFYKMKEALKLTQMPELGLWGLAASLIILLLAYIIACLKELSVELKGHIFTFPKFKTALLQILMASVQWMSLSFIIFYFLTAQGADVDYTLVLMTYLLASMAAVITHLPAGLGVLETIFLRMDLNLPAHEVLVALICFRAIYNLGPLLVCIPLYFYLEFKEEKTLV